MKANDPRVDELRNLSCEEHNQPLNPHIVTFENGDVSIRWNGCCDEIRNRAKAIAERK